MGNDGSTECPFCGYEIEWGSSDYPYLNKGCGGCGADFQISRAFGEIHNIQGLPRMEWEWNFYSKKGSFGRDEFEDENQVVDHLTRAVMEDPSNFLKVRPPVVSDERIREVMQDALGNDGPGVSKNHFTTRELEDMGLEVPA